MKVLGVFFLFCLFFTGCVSHGQKHTGQGVVKATLETFFSASFPPFASSFLIWYKDSTVIMEIPTTHFESKIGGPSIRRDTVTHYLYIDLKTMSFYQYGTFADTASLQKSYWQPDSLYVDGGWNFYFERGVIMSGKPEYLPDTVINLVHYKRIKFVSLEDKPLDCYSIGYIRCDRGTSMFSGEKIYTNHLNCIMDKIETYELQTGVKKIATGTIFLRDSLNSEEIKLFDVWEQYAKENQPRVKNQTDRRRRP